MPIAGDNSKVITLRLLQRKSIKSDVIFSQRSIERYAEVAVRNCKQATAAGMQFLQADGTLPSGWSRQDFFGKVLLVDIKYVKITNEGEGKKPRMEKIVKKSYCNNDPQIGFLTGSWHL